MTTLLQEAAKCFDINEHGHQVFVPDIPDEEIIITGDQELDFALINNKLNSVELYPFCTKRVICFYGERGTGKTNLCIQMGLNNLFSDHDEIEGKQELTYSTLYYSLGKGINNVRFEQLFDSQ